MADLSDVLAALRDAIAATLYPNGVPAGAMPASVVGSPVRVFRGWVDASLDADIKAGVANVSIIARPGVARQIGPYMDGWRELPRAAPSMTASVEGAAATFTGTNATPQQIAAVVVDGAAYTYPLQPADGPAQVVNALAAQIAADRPVIASGGVLTIPGASRLVARVVAGGGERREMRRLVQSIQITAWAPTQALRDKIIALIDDALINEWRVLDLPDGTKATLSYEGTAYDEEARQQPMHVRSLLYSVEYSQVRVRQAPGIAVSELDLEAAPAVITRTVLS